MNAAGPERVPQPTRRWSSSDARPARSSAAIASQSRARERASNVAPNCVDATDAPRLAAPPSARRARHRRRRGRRGRRRRSRDDAAARVDLDRQEELDLARADVGVASQLDRRRGSAPGARRASRAARSASDCATLVGDIAGEARYSSRSSSSCTNARRSRRRNVRRVQRREPPPSRARQAAAQRPPRGRGVGEARRRPRAGRRDLGEARPRLLELLGLPTSTRRARPSASSSTTTMNRISKAPPSRVPCQAYPNSAPPAQVRT